MPPNCTELNPVDYNIWAVIQQRVYEMQMHNIDELKQRVGDWLTSSVESTILEQTTLIGRKHSRSHAHWTGLAGNDVIDVYRNVPRNSATQTTNVLSEAARNPSLSVTPLITTAVSSPPAVRPGQITRSAARRRRIGAGAVSA